MVVPTREDARSPRSSVRLQGSVKVLTLDGSRRSASLSTICGVAGVWLITAAASQP
jgi:hypothetical protein